MYVSAVNRGTDSIELSVEGYSPIDCTEIKTADYSFESNDYEVIDGSQTVSGHSMIFMKLAPIAS